MGKDLAAVQQKTAEIVKETAGTPNAPYNYILVTFNDPGKDFVLGEVGVYFYLL